MVLDAFDAPALLGSLIMLARCCGARGLRKTANLDAVGPESTKEKGYLSLMSDADEENVIAVLFCLRESFIKV